MITHNAPTLPLQSLTQASTGRAWLERFPAARRSGVANMFHFGVRQGHSTPAAVVQQVTHDVKRQLQGATDHARETHLHAILEALQADRQGALAYAETVIAWEHLPHAERQRQKQERARHYEQAYMTTVAPTEKQIVALRFLGYTGDRPANRAEASVLIDELLSASQGDRP